MSFACAPLVNIPTQAHLLKWIKTRVQSACVTPFLLCIPRWAAHLEDNLLVRDNVQYILGHAVVDQSGHGPELSLGQSLAALGLDQVCLAALNPLDMTIQVAHLGNVGGLGRPG